MKPATNSFDVDKFVAGLVFELNRKANPKRAVEMSAYMRNLFPFLGVSAPDRTVILRKVSAEHGIPNQTQIIAAMRILWQMPEREFHIIATEFLNRHKKVLTKTFVSKHAKYFITNKSWWDSVDSLRPAIGYVVSTNRELDDVIYDWIESDNKWLVRSALIHQLVLKDKVDSHKLFALCERRQQDKEFFIAKAIGWALRDYSYVDPVAVKKFIKNHPDLSPLAKREGMKAINRKTARN